MLLDDGSPERGHRANLLNGDFRYAGFASGSHPSCGFALVMLMVDHFRARPRAKIEQMQQIVDQHIGKPAAVQTGSVGAYRSTCKQWDQLVNEVKPPHLQTLNQQQLLGVQTCNNPILHRPAAPRVTNVPLGQLKARPAVDPVVIRAFVHRVDANHDDFVEEAECLGLSHMHNLGFSPDDIASFFDEILHQRPQTEWWRRMVSWSELCAAAQLKKRYVPVVDLRVEPDGREGHVVNVELPVFLQWCAAIHADLSSNTPLLPEPPRSGSRSRSRKAVPAVSEINSFLSGVLSRQECAQVRELLCPSCMGLSSTCELKSVVCLGHRKLWAYQSRPHRDEWIRLIRASGLDPLVALPDIEIHKTIADHIDDGEARRTLSNIARADASLMSSVPSAGKVVVRDPPTRIRAARETDAAGSSDWNVTRKLDDAVRLTPWEERREHTESLVNQVINAKAAPRTCATDFALDAASESVPKQMQLAYTFEARRKFQQVVSTHSRESAEQRFLSMENSLRRRGTSMGDLVTKTHGSGAHSPSAYSGPRGHFHNSSAVLSASPEWPSSLPVHWDGEHIDHTKIEEMRPNPKYSKMDKEKRDQQFNCYFREKHNCCRNLKATVAADQIKERGQYGGLSVEFRPDCPQRHGSFGRRAFDPQVGTKPIINPHGTSEIETRPNFEYQHHAERAQEALERALPSGQKKHFKQNLPLSERPTRFQEMASRAQVNSVMDGAHKRQELGFFQNRHSDPTDMRLYSRPLGASQMDRLVPLY